MNFSHISLDYNSTRHLYAFGGGVIRCVEFHIESSYDNDYWFVSEGAQSIITLCAGTIYLSSASAKSLYPIGQCNDNSSAQCNILALALGGSWAQSKYDFTYLVEGRGTFGAFEMLDTISAPVVFSKSDNALIDGGFESATIVDWLATGPGAQPAIDATQHWDGSQSMKLAPTATNRCVAEAYLDCAPGAWLQLNFRWLFAGTASADHSFWSVQFYDKNGNALSSNAKITDNSSLPLVWTRATFLPFGQAPAGTRYARVSVSKEGAANAGSDGNGAIYLDDAHLSITGPKSGAQQTILQPSLRLTRTAAFSQNLPKGCAIDGIHIVNSTANAITGGLKIGSTLGGTDVAAALAVGAGADVYYPASALSKQYLSSSGCQIYYFDAVTAWNSASISITIQLRRATSQGY